MSGLFISFEGVDGVGKTTQAERLRRYAADDGTEVMLTREPGGTALGAAIREMVLHGVRNAADGVEERIGARAEALLFAADRAQHVAEAIAPVLRRGGTVITDRYIDSSLAYQAGGRELASDDVRNLNMWAVNALMPVRTYLLDMDPMASHRRLRHDEDRMESASDAFQMRTRKAFLDLAARDPQRFLVVDAGGPVDEVWDRIRRDFDALRAVGTAAADTMRTAETAHMTAGTTAGDIR